MDVKELYTWCQSHVEDLRQSLMEGTYVPNPVRRVEIPKDNGKKRQLGIPTVIDRMVQQAISQVLSGIYERKFSRTQSRSTRCSARSKEERNRRLQVCRGHRLGTLFRHRESKQTDRGARPYNQGRTSSVTDTQVSTQRRYGTRSIAADGRGHAARWPLESVAQQYHVERA